MARQDITDIAGTVDETVGWGGDMRGAFSTLEDVVLGDGVTDIVRITQAEYDELDPPDATTLYLIID